MAIEGCGLYNIGLCRAKGGYVRLTGILQSPQTGQAVTVRDPEPLQDEGSSLGLWD